MAKNVRLIDIAKALGVSTVTVSNALTNKPGVSDKLRGEIINLAKEMEYDHPNLTGKGHKQGGKNIGIIVSDKYISKNTSFYWELYQHVVVQATQMDCFTILEVLSMEDERNLVYPKVLREKVDGFIIVGQLKKKYLDMLEENSRIPYLFLDYYGQKPDQDYIVSDSYYGMYLMTNYLFDMGHKDIAFVGNRLATSSITDRYFGYAKSLLEHGVKIREDWLLNDRDNETGDILINLPETMPTAFSCNCDFVASRLIKILNAKGYRVPEDISVVGFDNFIFNGLSDVEITTYEVNVKEMARISIESILGKIISNDKCGRRIVGGKMIIKESVKDIS